MSNGRIDPDFEAKLHLYKTAFSPLYNTYVGINGLRKLPDGSYILDCVVPFNEALIMFRPHELTNFVMQIVIDTAPRSIYNSSHGQNRLINKEI